MKMIGSGMNDATRRKLLVTVGVDLQGRRERGMGWEELGREREEWE